MCRSKFSSFHKKFLRVKVGYHPSFWFQKYLKSRMEVSYTENLPHFKSTKVHIKDVAYVNRLIDEIIKGGKDMLQVVSDFDRTITKQHENGKIHLSSFGIFAKCKTLPQRYKDEDERLMKKYLPIEIDPNIPFEDKKKLMEEWWTLSEQILDGLEVSDEDIDQVVTELGPSIRDNALAMFSKLNELNVPVLVFSAGLGDTVVAVLKHFKVYLPNVHVVSNFLRKDENGIIRGFKHNLINIYNKNEAAIKGTEYYDLVKDRPNVIVMGDSLGDAMMAEGLPNANAVLKIGFLYDHVSEFQSFRF